MGQGNSTGGRPGAPGGQMQTMQMGAPTPMPGQMQTMGAPAPRPMGPMMGFPGQANGGAFPGQANGGVFPGGGMGHSQGIPAPAFDRPNAPQFPGQGGFQRPIGQALDARREQGFNPIQTMRANVQGGLPTPGRDAFQAARQDWQAQHPNMAGWMDQRQDMRQDMRQDRMADWQAQHPQWATAMDARREQGFNPLQNMIERRQAFPGQGAFPGQANGGQFPGGWRGGNV
jgi:hypothetical protein